MGVILTEAMREGRAKPNRGVHFKFDEADTATTVSCSVRGSVLTLTEAAAIDGNGLAASRTTAGGITLAPLPSFANTASVAVIICGKQGAGNARGAAYGSSTAAEDGCSVVNNQAVRFYSDAGDVSNTTDGTLPSTGEAFMICGLADRASGTQRLFQQIASGDVAEAGTALSLGAWESTTIDQNIYLSTPLGIIVGRTTYYSILVYAWTGGLPADFLTGLEYYAANPKAGIKDPYPGWE